MSLYVSFHNTATKLTTAGGPQNLASTNTNDLPFSNPVFWT